MWREGGGRYPLKNVNSCLVAQRFPRSAKPWQVQEFTSKPGRQRGVPAAPRGGGKHLEREGGNPPLVAPPALLVTAQGQAAESW